VKSYNLLRIALVLLLLGSMSLAADEGGISKVEITIADMSTILMQTTFRIDGPARETPRM
jgi:hypothetical protein